MVFRKNTERLDPVHSSHKEFVSFSSLEADLSHGPVVNGTDTGLGFRTLQNNHCSSLIKHDRKLIKDVVPDQRLNCVLPHSFQCFIDENRTVFEIYITPCQSQNLPFANARRAAIPSSENPLCCNNFLISSLESISVGLENGFGSVAL